MLDTNIGKQPFKLIEIPLNKFKDEVIPHHQLVFANFKVSIEKCLAENKYSEVERELQQKTNIIRHLKSLIYELDLLKTQVEDSKIEEFDKQALPLKRAVQKLINDYLDLELVAKSKLKHYADHNLEDDVANISIKNCQLELEDFVDLKLDDEQKQLKQIEELNKDIVDVHHIFGELHEIVEQQQESVTLIENNVEVSSENTKWGLKNLMRAARLKGTSYVVAGTCIGTMVGGPIGSIAGFKVGAVAAIGCGVVGYVGGKFLKKRKLSEIKNTETTMNEIEMKNQVDLEQDVVVKKLL